MSNQERQPMRAFCLLAIVMILSTAAASKPEKDPLIIPAPASVTWSGGEAAVAQPAMWSLACPRGEERLVRAVRRVLRERLGAQVGQGAVRYHDQPWAALRIGEQSFGSFPPFLNGKKPRWASNPEGYRLDASAGRIEIVAPTARGAFYGLQTLTQLLKPHSDRITMRAAVIEDWPALGFRGAHWFPSASGVGFHRKLIQRVMAPHKLNYAVIQCEAAKWDSHPEIAAPNSISRKDLRALVDLCRENYIEPIPLINCPGHAQWLFRNNQNLHLAEDAATPYAYCVSHPESDVVIKEILTEAIEVFRARYVHLGHDEVTLRGRFPSPDCPRCQGRSATELVLENARRLSAWLKERKIQPVIWGDMLLAKGESADGSAHAPNLAEAQERRAGVPREAIIADWHYGQGDQYPSLNLFRKQGLKTIAVTWDKPLNIYHFARAARRSRSMGLLQSTWCGYFPDGNVLRGASFPQFSAFILAAEYAWSARAEPPDRLSYDPAVVFRQAYGK
jgi:hypothetical protein